MIHGKFGPRLFMLSSHLYVSADVQAGTHEVPTG